MSAARASFLTLLLGLAVGSPALADGFIIVEPPIDRPRRIRPPTPGPFPLAVGEHRVTVEIEDQVATTSVDQTFINPTGARLEGTYMFPLPEDAAVTDFSLWIDWEETAGEVLNREKALEIYEGIVRRLKDPALLEYAGRGMFKVRIFPIEPRSTRRIKLTYRQVLKADAGRVRYVYPLNTEKFSSKPLQDASVVVSISGGTPIKGVYSPYQDVDLVRTGETTAKASWEAHNVKPNKDFVLDYDLGGGSELGMSLRTHRGSSLAKSAEGTFLLLISPGKADRAQRVAKDVVFVVDTSGSMTKGDKLEQVRSALRYGVTTLGPEDRFAIVNFATTARVFQEELVSASSANKAEAKRYIDELAARGGTAIDEALQRALKYQPQAEGQRPFQVVFLTDGQPTIGEVEPERILERLSKARAARSRVFVWGVGGDLDARLLDRIALDNRGERNYVLPGEDAEVALSAFYDKIAAPVMTDLALKFEGQVRVSDVYPRQLPDLFQGGQLVVVGRYQGEGPLAVRLRGQVQGQPRELVYETTLQARTDSPHIPLLWAQRKIGFLLDQIRLREREGRERQELVAAVVELAQRYGLPTPYTSYLVVEDQPLEGGPPRPQTRGGAAAREAFGRLRRAAEQSGAGGGGPPMAPAAEADGEDAVREAKDVAELRKGDKANAPGFAGLREDEVAQAMRKVGERTFYNSGNGWVEASVAEVGEDATRIAYLSDEYFAFVKQNPGLGAILALGQVTFVHDGEVVVIGPEKQK